MSSNEKGIMHVIECMVTTLFSGQTTVVPMGQMLLIWVSPLFMKNPYVIYLSVCLPFILFNMPRKSLCSYLSFLFPLYLVCKSRYLKASESQLAKLL